MDDDAERVSTDTAWDDAVDYLTDDEAALLQTYRALASDDQAVVRYVAHLGPSFTAWLKDQFPPESPPSN